MTTKNIFKLLAALFLLCFVYSCKSPANPTDGGNSDIDIFQAPPAPSGYSEVYDKTIKTGDFKSSYDNYVTINGGGGGGNTYIYYDSTGNLFAVSAGTGEALLGASLIEEVILEDNTIYRSSRSFYIKAPAETISGGIPKKDDFSSIADVKLNFNFSSYSNINSVDLYLKIEPDLIYKLERKIIN